MISTHRLSANTDAPASVCGIYAIRNNKNGKFYVGQVGGTNGRGFLKRCQEHFYNATESKSHHSYSALGRSIRRYGAENFDFIVLEIIDKDCDNEFFHAAEVRWMYQLNSITPNGYNVHFGPTPRGTKRSIETKQKMSEARKKMLSENPDLLNKLKDRLAARNRSDESIEKIKNLNTSPEFQVKRIDALRKVMHTPEHKEKMRLAVAKLWSDPVKVAAAKALRSKPVICVDTGEKFDSARDAANYFGGDSSAITKVCKGKLKTTKGMRFSYAGDAE